MRLGHLFCYAAAENESSILSQEAPHGDIQHHRLDQGFSENPGGESLNAKSIIEMLDLIGDEKVRPPGVVGRRVGRDAGAPLITRQELLARVLWTRAIPDADGASTKLIIEYLDGKPDEAEAAPGEAPAFNADDMALAEALLREGLSNDHPFLS